MSKKREWQRETERERRKRTGYCVILTKIKRERMCKKES